MLKLYNYVGDVCYIWSSMHSGVSVIIVDNCNLTQAEMDPFIREGVKYGYSIHLLETNTPWRYNPKKLLKLTHNGFNLSEISNMLGRFDRTLNIETILSSQKNLPPTVLSTGRKDNHSNDHNEVIPSSAIIHNSVDNGNTPITLVKYLYEPVCYHSNDDNKSGDIYNLAHTSNTSNTTTDELDQGDEKWTTPMGSIEALNINQTCSDESTAQDDIDHQTSMSEQNESVPRPSTSGGKLAELSCIFPNLKSELLQEFLSLAHDDVSWATTLILDNRTCERICQDDGSNQYVIESKLSSDNSSGNQTSSSVSVTACASSAMDVSNNTTENRNLLSSENEHSLEECTLTFNENGIKFSRSFIKAAHQEYAFSLGLSDVDLSPEAVPDFLINEWIPEPNLTKEIYISIMRHLGVLPNSSVETLIQKFPSSNTRSSSQVTTKGTSAAPKLPSSTFLQIMHDEEGLLRSVEDFRTSLNAPVIRLIMNRLMSKFPGTQKSVIEEAFVRCEFDETRTEIYLSSYYKSASELVENSGDLTSVVATALTTPSSTNKPNVSSYIAQQSTNVDTLSNNQSEVLGHQSVEEKLSLQEIQDEEEALNRSIEDQKIRLQTLANQLSLSRLKAQFPGIEISYLENLFIRFDLSEQNLLDYLIKKGFIPQPLNPFLVENSDKFVENVDADINASPLSYGQDYLLSNSLSISNNNINNSEWLNMLDEKIDSIRKKISNVKTNLSYAKDSRIKQFRVTELRSLQSQLHYFSLQKAEHLVDARSSMFEEELLNKGERPINAACLAFSYVDLHGLNKSCALSILQQRLAYLRDKMLMMKTTGGYQFGLGVPKYFTVITGRAAGCEADVVSTSPILRPAVIHYLIRNGYKFEENFRTGSGHFTVNLNNQKLNSRM
ncbi:unnamed protein product [Heterobilharzia americana]|nr:unnamed protein product [Heterobilharzia americana]